MNGKIFGLCTLLLFLIPVFGLSLNIYCQDNHESNPDLTVSEIIDALTDFINWTPTGKNCYGWNQQYHSITRENESAVKVLTYMEYYTFEGISYKYGTKKVSGNIFKFKTIIDQCDHTNPGSCPVTIQSVIQVVSKSYVKETHTVTDQNTDNSVVFKCEYRK